MSEITIYSFDKCPFAQRTRMVLIEKDLPFELVEIDVYNKPDWFSSISPYGKVPVYHMKATPSMNLQSSMNTSKKHFQKYN